MCIRDRVTPSLVGKELSRFLRLCKAAKETSCGISTWIKYSGDGVAQLLRLEPFYNFIFTVILETSSAAHPDYTALHLGTLQTPRMAMATYIYVSRLT